MSDKYLEFLQSKVVFAPESGFDVDLSDINPALKPHVRVSVQWALRGGRRAICSAFGLHKTSTSLEIGRLLLSKGKAKRPLVILPLGVRQEFIKEAAARFTGAFSVRLKFVRTSAEIDLSEDGVIYLTNYESVRDGKIDPKLFDAVLLDEAAILRSFGSKTYQEFLTIFAHTAYRFVATATPSPNRYKELLHYAAFLGVMDSGQALTRWFQRDSTKANNLTLYPHKEREFWLWVNSWALFLQSPADLGFDATGYELPPLKVVFHELPSDIGTKADSWGQVKMFRDASLGLSDAAQEKRDTMISRILAMREIIDANPTDHFLLWHDLEDERRAIEAAIPGVVTVYGSQDLEKREQAVADFADGKIPYLAGKPVMLGSGCNLQRFCHKAIFLGVGYKFNDFIQACHRIHRFGQTQPVEIHIIHTEAEREVLRVLLAKWEQHKEMVGKMTAIIKEFGLNRQSMADVLTRTIGVERIEVKGKNFTAANNDCVLETRRWPDNIFGLIFGSWPFGDHYEYCASYMDFGHNSGNRGFFTQLDHLTPELHRTLQPGRILAVHVKDRIEFGNVTGNGFPTVDPFHVHCINHHMKHGFLYCGMITVVTDVVRENNQTYRLGWSENAKDGTKMGVGCPEYVLLFRKAQTDKTKGYADVPVAKSKQDYTRARWQVDAHAFWRSSGNRLLTAAEMAEYGPGTLAKMFTEFSLQNIYDYEYHVQIGEELEAKGALPSSFMSLAPGSHDPDVWHDVNRMRTLNGSQAAKGKEMHVCPLQFDIVDRIISRYTNPGELVYDPFCGLGTVPLRAMKLGRRGAGSELNTQYFFDSVHYLKAMEEEINTPTLFDFEDTPDEQPETPTPSPCPPEQEKKKPTRTPKPNLKGAPDVGNLSLLDLPGAMETATPAPDTPPVESERTDESGDNRPRVWCPDCESTVNRKYSDQFDATDLCPRCGSPYGAAFQKAVREKRLAHLSAPVAPLPAHLNDPPPHGVICALCISCVTDGRAARALQTFSDAVEAAGRKDLIPRINEHVINWPEVVRLVNEINRGVASMKPVPNAHAIEEAQAKLPVYLENLGLSKEAVL